MRVTSHVQKRWPSFEVFDIRIFGFGLLFSQLRGNFIYNHRVFMSSHSHRHAKYITGTPSSCAPSFIPLLLPHQKVDVLTWVVLRLLEAVFRQNWSVVAL